jgi:TM2 domain-containing membrane protein YozV
MLAEVDIVIGRCTHWSIIVFEPDSKLIHSINCHPKTIKYVVEDNDPPFLLLVLGKSILGVDQFHLLQNCRFTTLSGTWDLSSLILSFILPMGWRASCGEKAYPIARVSRPFASPFHPGGWVHLFPDFS